MNYLTGNDLRARGWTHALVRRFLDPPDKIGPHPKIRPAVVCRLYDGDRVAKLFATEEVQAALKNAKRR